jgi:hypothetical protein
MKTALRYGAQALLYAAFVAVIGYLSTSPAYQHLAPGEALLKLSLTTPARARKPAVSAAPKSSRSSRPTCARNRSVRASACRSPSK